MSAPAKGDPERRQSEALVSNIARYRPRSGGRVGLVVLVLVVVVVLVLVVLVVVLMLVVLVLVLLVLVQVLNEHWWRRS